MNKAASADHGSDFKNSLAALLAKGNPNMMGQGPRKT